MTKCNHRSTFTLLGLALATGAFAGELTSRMELSLDRVQQGGPPVYSDDFVLADAVPQHVRRFTEFSGDVSGRYVGALATVSQLKGRKFPELDRIAAKIVPLQKTDGHFGDPFNTGEVTNSDMALLWGKGRLLIGLLEYYRLKPTPAVLTCAKRLGDCFVKLGPRFNDPAIMQQFSGDQVAVGYICWTQIIEGLVELNRATHDEEYLRLAKEIADNTHRYPKEHSHGFVSALRGVLELYRVTHDARWLQKVETEWDGIIASGNLLPQGALPEIFKPLIARDEGCAEADWLRLNFSLWRLTGDGRYLDAAERSLKNHFIYQQFPNGGAGHRLLHQVNNQTVAFKGLSEEAWWCCGEHWARAMVDVARSAVVGSPRGLFINLAIDCDATVAGPGGPWKTALRETEDGLSIRLKPARLVKADVRIHRLQIPGPGVQSGSVDAPKGFKVSTDGDVWVVSGTWRGLQELRVHLPIALRVETASDGAGILLRGHDLLAAHRVPANAWLTDNLPARRPGRRRWDPGPGRFRNGRRLPGQ